MRGCGVVPVVMIASGCLTAPPEALAVDGRERAPCEDVLPEGCSLFSCPNTTSCYRLCAEETTYLGAGCGGGSWLLETETREELDCARANNGDSMWIGLVQDEDASAVDTAWRWQSTDQPPETTFWDPVEPNDDPTAGENTEEQCAIIAAHSGEWADVACQATMPSFVCEHASP